MTTAGSAGPRPLTSPMLVPGRGHPWCAIDCWAVAATLDGQLQRRRSRHRQAVLKELVGWHCGAATQHPGTDRQTLCVHQATATPASKCTVHQNYVCPSVPTQNGRWGGAPNLPCHVSRRPSEGRQWKMHVLGNYICHLACAAMWCLYAIRYVGWTSITRNFWPLILRHWRTSTLHRAASCHIHVDFTGLKVLGTVLSQGPVNQLTVSNPS